MNYTPELRTKTKENLELIIKYIEENILPHIDYDYETPEFGPDEKSGKRLTIRLNNSHEKIQFRHADIPFTIEDVERSSYFTRYAVWFLEYWHDAKYYMHTEIQNNKDTINLINEFEI